MTNRERTKAKLLKLAESDNPNEAESARRMYAIINSKRDLTAGYKKKPTQSPVLEVWA